VTGTNPAGLVSGIARVTPNGTGTWVGVAAAAGDPSIVKPVLNCAPALSNDGTTVYIAANRGATSATQNGVLLALDSTTLATRASVALLDPNLGGPARLSDDGTATPVVGPDGRVFYGVLERTFGTHNARGWLLQFDAALNPVGVPGSFGWDVSPSVIPASMVPSYTGTSTYLLAQKYNNYAGVGTGVGLNQLAVLDPGASQADAITPTVQVMREVLTILGPTLDAGSTTARREWCINTMARGSAAQVDPRQQRGRHPVPLGPDHQHVVAGRAAQCRASDRPTRRPGWVPTAASMRSATRPSTPSAPLSWQDLPRSPLAGVSAGTDRRSADPW
jgi:hypothetical protein